jgi:sensitive to high expression protein 9
MATPPPALDSQPTPQPKDRLSGSVPSPEDQQRLQRRLDALLEDQKAIKKATEQSVAALKEPPPTEVQKPQQEDAEATPTRDESLDNIARVPDEHLPSHQERQRWDLSRRFSEAMDELLPKLAVVGHKVNTYTGTDYSGVEALRREIKEQGRYREHLSRTIPNVA